MEPISCLPASNAKLEQFVSLTTRIKTDNQFSLGECQLNSKLDLNCKLDKNKIRFPVPYQQ